MRTRTMAAASLIFCVFCMLLGTSLAEDKKNLNKATNTVNNIRKADPPKASNTPKQSPVGQKTSEYRPKQKSPESKKIVVPPPGR